MWCILLLASTCCTFLSSLKLLFMDYFFIYIYSPQGCVLALEIYLLKVKTFLKWHVLHLASVWEIRRQKDTSGCQGEATESAPALQQGFTLTSQGETEWRMGRLSSTSVIHWWKKWKPMSWGRKGCFTMKMKCHKLLPAPTVGSEDKLISETQCSGYFHHCVHFGYYPWYDLAQCEQPPGKSFFLT